jgi:hypothetical protein
LFECNARALPGLQATKQPSPNKTNPARTQKEKRRRCDRGRWWGSKRPVQLLPGKQGRARAPSFAVVTSRFQARKQKIPWTTTRKQTSALNQGSSC